MISSLPEAGPDDILITDIPSWTSELQISAVTDDFPFLFTGIMIWSM